MILAAFVNVLNELQTKARVQKNFIQNLVFHHAHFLPKFSKSLSESVVNSVAKNSRSALVKCNRAQRNLVNCFSGMTCMNKSWVLVSQPTNRKTLLVIIQSWRKDKRCSDSVNFAALLAPYSCSTLVKEIVSSMPHLFRVDDRVARLAFLRPNSRNFAWKSGVCHVRHGFAFFWPFLTDAGVGIKKHCLAFFSKPLAQWLLLTWNYITFSQDNGPLFSTTLAFSKIQSALLNYDTT